MKIQYCSDLHLELRDNSRYIKYNPIEIVGDILILAGDITYRGEEYYKHPFFNFVSDNFEKVYMISGNHEFYKGFDLKIQDEPEQTKIRENVYIVNNKSIVIDNVNFIFSTLWAEINPVHSFKITTYITDFHLIKYHGNKLTPDNFTKLHKKSLEFLQKAFDNNKSEKMVVVTHHLPADVCMVDEFRGNSLNSAFMTDLHSFVEKSNADFWIYGHSHRNKTPQTIGKTKLLTNQLGYVAYNENLMYKNDAFFIV